MRVDLYFRYSISADGTLVTLNLLLEFTINMTTRDFFSKRPGLENALESLFMLFLASELADGYHCFSQLVTSSDKGVSSLLLEPQCSLRIRCTSLTWKRVWIQVNIRYIHGTDGWNRSPCHFPEHVDAATQSFALFIAQTLTGDM